MSSAPAAPLNLAAPSETREEYVNRNRILEINRYITQCESFINRYQSRIDLIKFREDNTSQILNAIETFHLEITYLRMRIKVAKFIKIIVQNMIEGEDVEDTITDKILEENRHYARILLRMINAEAVHYTPETKMLRFLVNYNPPRIRNIPQPQDDYDDDVPPPPPLGLPALIMHHTDLGHGAFHGKKSRSIKNKKRRTKKK